MSFTGTSGNDTNAATGGTIVGLEGSDSLTGDDTPNTMLGNQNNDTLVANGQNDTVYAGQNDDVVSAGFGFDVIYGNEGSDTLLGNQDNDTINGGNDAFGSGDVSVNTLVAGLGNDRLFGAGGHDLMLGNENNDTLVGNAGNDTSIGGKGDDSHVGGEGVDEVQFAGDFTRYQFESGAGGELIVRDLLQSPDSDGNDTIAGNVEFIRFGGYSGTDVRPVTPQPPAPIVTAFIDQDLPDSPPGSFTRPEDDSLYAGGLISDDHMNRLHIEVPDGGVVFNGEDPDLVWNLRYRQGEALVPTSATFSGHTLDLEYTAFAGPQSAITSPDFGPNPDRAATNDQPGIHNTTLQELLASGAVIERFYDVDPTAGEILFGIHASYEPGINANSGIVWRINGNNLPFILDDGGTTEMDQNSFNRTIIPGFMVSQLVVGAEFDDYFRISFGGQEVAAIHMETNLVAPPPVI